MRTPLCNCATCSALRLTDSCQSVDKCEEFNLPLRSAQMLCRAEREAFLAEVL